jgi:Rrf2 family protein
MLSNMCKTAVKAVIYLATRSGKDEKSSLKEVADFIGANEHTVGKILQQLVRQKVIHSLKGPGGGFYISEHQMNQPAKNIILAIDGNDLFTGCGLGLTHCSSERPCPIHNEYMVVRTKLNEIFAGNTIRDLCNPVNEGIAYLIS